MFHPIKTNGFVDTVLVKIRNEFSHGFQVMRFLKKIRISEWFDGNDKFHVRVLH